ncbi:hypothetical protein DM860_012154 [Cuscuta australis]|uniref:Uncharacterized protein n=1 Tax=Cuscuta australis TaxID=267555 RepID=A0A328DDR2_9ASTE|nr:hypothetical protein DM860_012154 [Cuscuta australis]
MQIEEVGKISLDSEVCEDQATSKLVITNQEEEIGHQLWLRSSRRKRRRPGLIWQPPLPPKQVEKAVNNAQANSLLKATNKEGMKKLADTLGGDKEQKWEGCKLHKVELTKMVIKRHKILIIDRTQHFFVE